MSKEKWTARIWALVNTPAELAGATGMVVVAGMGIYGMLNPPPYFSEWALLAGLFLFATLWGGSRVLRVSKEGVEFAAPEVVVIEEDKDDEDNDGELDT